MIIDGVLERAKCVLDQRSIEDRIAALATQINSELEDPQHIICVLTGGIMFTGQLIKHLKMPITLDYIHATRYQGKLKGQDVQWVITPHLPLDNQEVLIVDDIYDEGHTLHAVIDACYKGGAKKVRTVMMIDKQHNRKAKPDYQCDFVAFDLGDDYLFGYGMDYKSFYRNTPNIYAAHPSDCL